MIPGISPVIIRKQAPAPSGYSFTMTAGYTSVSGGFYGYFPPLAIGSINAQPVPGHTLFACASSVALNESSVAFTDDALSLVGGLKPWIDGVDVGFSVFANTSGQTGSTVPRSTFTFEEGETYFIEFK